MNLSNRTKRNIGAGFTLMEMLLAILAFGTFMSLVLIGVARQQASRRDVARVATMDQLQKALAMYISDTQQYPVMKGCITGADPLMVEMRDKKYFDDKVVVKDPKNPNEIGGCYYYEGDGGTYSLRYILETDSVGTKGEHFIKP